MRNEDWPEQLDKVIEEYRHKAFVWGESDCCNLTADCIKVVTGKDYMKKLRGLYKTDSGAYKILKKQGYDTLEDYMESNFVEISPFMAIRGDAVMMDQAVGICLGSKCAFMTKDGLAFIEISKIETAWSIN